MIRLRSRSLEAVLRLALATLLAAPGSFISESSAAGRKGPSSNPGRGPSSVPAISVTGAAAAAALTPSLPAAGISPVPTLAAPAVSAPILPPSEPALLPSQAQPVRVPASGLKGTQSGALQATPSEDPGSDGEAQGALGSLQEGVRAIADDSAAAPQVLETLFSGGKLGKMLRGPQDPALAASRDVQQMGLVELEGHAKWWEAPVEERLAAVRRIANIGAHPTAPEPLPGSAAAVTRRMAQAALGRVAEANPLGGLDDYEVHRLALHLLAWRFDVLRSLRPVSPLAKAELKDSLRSHRPDLVVSDYDDTAQKFAQDLPAEAGDKVRGVLDTGTQMAFLSDRPDYGNPQRPGDRGVIESLQNLSPEQKAGLQVVSNKGLRLSAFDQSGEAKIAQEQTSYWGAGERAVLEAGRNAVLERYETQAFRGEHWKLDDSSLVIFLKVGTPPATVQEAADFLRQEMARRGVTRYDVVGRTPQDPTNPPYLAVSNLNKSWGMRLLTRSRGGPNGSRTLILGDQFMTQGAGRPTDSYMIDGAPDALVIAVGESADPRYGRTFLWDVRGPAGWNEIMDAVGGSVQRSAGATAGNSGL